VHPVSVARLEGGAVAARRESIEDDLLSFPMPSEASLRSLFDLTSAEARLARRLATGNSLEEAARALSIKMTTARTQLAAPSAPPASWSRSWRVGLVPRR